MSVFLVILPVIGNSRCSTRAAIRVGVVLQPAAVAHLSIEHLAGGEGLAKVCFPHTATEWRLLLQTLSN